MVRDLRWLKKYRKGKDGGQLLNRFGLIFYFLLLIITLSLLSCGKKAPPVLSNKESFVGLVVVRGTHTLDSVIDINNVPSPNLSDLAGCSRG